MKTLFQKKIAVLFYVGTAIYFLLSTSITFAHIGTAIAEEYLDIEQRQATPGVIVDKNKPFYQYTWLTAHNAFNASGWPNQNLSVKDLLERGVRGLMFDTHWHNNEVYLCHNTCNIAIGDVSKLKDRFTTISNFLAANRDAVITIHFEDYVTKQQMQHAFSASPQIAQYVFNPGKWISRNNWPTLQEMINANQRLILLTQRGELSGNYNNNVYMFHDQNITVENYWSLGGTIGSHDMSCNSRWGHIPLNSRTTTHPDVWGWNRLFVMNHFHGVPEYYHSGFDNRWDWVQNRIDDTCTPAAGRHPNYLAVDFVEQGDVLEYVEWKNNGGIIAYEGNNATQDVVCGFSTATRRNIRLQDSDAARLGCENDEMRSLKLRGVKAGQRITFYDHPNGSRDDDYTIIDIKRDIPPEQFNIISSFEQTVEATNYRQRYSGGNNLDGKVSYIKVEPTPTKLSEAAIVLLRGNNGSQRISCTFGITTRGFWNIKNLSACHNDDARSAKLMAGKAGTKVTVYDSPSGSTGDDYTVITVLKDFDMPLIINSFESNYQNEFIKVQYFRKNGLDGKVSSVLVE